MSKFNKRALVSLKSGLFLVTLGYILYKVFNVPDSGAFNTGWAWSDAAFTSLFLLCCAGMLLNWTFETAKWHFLYNKVRKINWPDAWKGVLCGTAISIWMPNRMGDYIGRMLYIPGNQYGKAIFCSLLGNFSQFLVTIIFGSAGLLYYLFILNSPGFGTDWIIFASLFIMSISLIFYLFLPYLLPYLPHKAGKYNLVKYIRVLYRFSLRERLGVLGYSALRYVVFTTQYWLLLQAFGVGIPFTTCIALIAVIFLVQSIIPSFALTEVGVRGAASLFFLGAFSVNTPGIIMATYTLWAINLVIPAAFGAWFILRSNISAETKPAWMAKFIPVKSERNG